MPPGNHAKRTALHIRSSQTANRASSFFAKKRDTLLSCIGGFSGIGNMANDEIERLRLTDEERQAIERQADWMSMQAQEAGDISADLRSQEAHSAWPAGEDAMSEWIPVSERLPPEETRVLAYDGDKVFESEYWSGRWEWCADVTHWMPLPEPPEVK
jgi:hypothetical protein